MRLAATAVGLGAAAYSLALAYVYVRERSAVGGGLEMDGYFAALAFLVPAFTLLASMLVFTRGVDVDSLMKCSCLVVPGLAVGALVFTVTLDGRVPHGVMAFAGATGLGTPLSFALWALIRKLRRLSASKTLVGTAWASAGACLCLGVPLSFAPVLAGLASVHHPAYVACLMAASLFVFALLWGVVHRCLFAGEAAAAGPPRTGAWGGTASPAHGAFAGFLARRRRAHRAASAVVFLSVAATVAAMTVTAWDDSFATGERAAGMVVAGMGVLFAVLCVPCGALDVRELGKYASLAAASLACTGASLAAYRLARSSRDQALERGGDGRDAAAWMRLSLYASVAVPVAAFGWNLAAARALAPGPAASLATFLGWPKARVPLTYATLSGAMCALFFFPLGAVLPAYLVYRESVADEGGPLVHGLQAAALAPPALATLFLAWRAARVSSLAAWRRLFRVRNPVRAASWLAGAAVFASCALLVVSLALSADESHTAALLAAALMLAPAYAWVYARAALAKAARPATKYRACAAAAAAACAALAAGGALAGADWGEACLTAAGGVAAAAALLCLAWAASDAFGATHPAAAVTGSLCCAFAALPALVLVPLGVLGAGLTLQRAVNYSLTLFMLGVMSASVVLNARLRRIEEERRARLATLVLRRALDTLLVRCSRDLARVLYDEYCHTLGDAERQRRGAPADTIRAVHRHEFSRWLASRDAVSWVRDPRRAGHMELVLAEGRTCVEPDAGRKPGALPPPAATTAALQAGLREKLGVPRRWCCCGGGGAGNDGSDDSQGGDEEAQRRETKERPGGVPAAAKGENDDDDGAAAKRRWGEAKARLMASGRGEWALVAPRAEVTRAHREQLLRRTFASYATSVRSNADRPGERTRHMSCESFRRFVRDSRLLGPGFTRAHVDLIYVRLTGKYVSRAGATLIDYGTWQRSLVDLAAAAFPHMPVARGPAALRRAAVAKRSPSPPAPPVSGRASPDSAASGGATDDVDVAAAVTPATDGTGASQTALDRLVFERVFRFARKAPPPEKAAAPSSPRAAAALAVSGSNQLIAVGDERGAGPPRLLAHPRIAGLLKRVGLRFVVERQLRRDEERYGASDGERVADADRAERVAVVARARAKARRRTENCLARCLGRLGGRGGAGAGETPRILVPGAGAVEVDDGELDADADGGDSDDSEVEEEKEEDEEEVEEQTTTWEAACSVAVAALEATAGRGAEDGGLLPAAAAMAIEASASNVLAVLGMAFELASLLAVIFSPSVPWGLSDGSQTAASAAILDYGVLYPGSFAKMFVACAGVAVLFPVLAVPGARHANRGTLGLAANGRPAPALSLQFALVKALSLFGSVLYLPILIKLASAFACGEPEADGSSRMVHSPEQRCWEGEHLAYCAAAVVAGVCYYPAASFLYPNLQFADRSLDLKFSPSFLVLLAQVKLAVSALAAFYPDEPYRLTACCGAACLALWAVSRSFAPGPCLVRRASDWLASSFLLAAWAAVAAFVVTASGRAAAGWVLLAAGWAVLLWRAARTDRAHLRDAARHDATGKADVEMAGLYRAPGTAGAALVQPAMSPPRMDSGLS